MRQVSWRDVLLSRHHNTHGVVQAVRVWGGRSTSRRGGRGGIIGCVVLNVKVFIIVTRDSTRRRGRPSERSRGRSAAGRRKIKGGFWLFKEGYAVEEGKPDVRGCFQGHRLAVGRFDVDPCSRRPAASLARGRGLGAPFPAAGLPRGLCGIARGRAKERRQGVKSMVCVSE